MIETFTPGDRSPDNTTDASPDGQAQSSGAASVDVQATAADQMLAVLGQALDAAIVVANADGQIICAGPACRAILDDLARAFAGPDAATAPRRVDGSPWAAADLPLVRALTHGETCRASEVSWRGPDGVLRCILASGAPVRDRDGRIIAAAGLLEDVTAQRQTERALAESEERFSLLLGNAPVIVFTADRDLRYTGVYCSESGATQVKQEMLGKRDDELAPYDDVSEMMAVKRAVITSGIPYRGEVRVGLRRPFKYYYVSAEPLRDALGRVIGLAVASWDITARKQAEEDAQEARSELSAIAARLVQANRKRALRRKPRRMNTSHISGRHPHGR